MFSGGEALLWHTDESTDLVDLGVVQVGDIVCSTQKPRLFCSPPVLLLGCLHVSGKYWMPYQENRTALLTVKLVS